jgi:putative transposase
MSTPVGFTPGVPNPCPPEVKDNQAITGQIKQCWLESGAVYGYRKIHDDLRHLGIICGQQRVDGRFIPNLVLTNHF